MTREDLANGDHMTNESRPLRSIVDEAHGERPYAERKRHVIELEVLRMQQPQPTAEHPRAKAEKTLAALSEARPDEVYLVLATAAVWAARLTEDVRCLTEEVRPLCLTPSPEVQNAVERVRHEVAHCTAAIDRVRREIERARSR